VGKEMTNCETDEHIHTHTSTVTVHLFALHINRVQYAKLVVVPVTQ